MFDVGQLACIGDSVDATYSRVADKFTVTNLPYMRKEADSVIGSNLPNWPVDEMNAWVTVITSACENVEAAVQYLNYGYTYEGSLYFSFGLEGEHWNWGDDGLPKFTDVILNNADGMTISNVSYALKIHFGSRYCYLTPSAIQAPRPMKKLCEFAPCGRTIPTNSPICACRRFLLPRRSLRNGRIS